MMQDQLWYDRPMGHHHGHHHHTHGHAHSHAHSHGATPSSGLGSALLLNTAFTLLEFWGGWWTNSTAILSDAVHDLGDSFALALTWYFEKLSHKGRTARFSYGYRRLSVLAALLSSGVLLGGSLWVLLEAVPRLFHPEAVHVPGMLAFAVVGIVANGLAFWRLHGGLGPAEKAARLHLLEDVMGWVAVLVGSVLLYFTGWQWLDPLLSIGITLFILWNVVGNIKSFGAILLQAVPETISQETLLDKLRQVPGVQDIHDVHIWTLDSQNHVMSLHVLLAPDAGPAAPLKQQLRTLIHAHGIGHATLELEYPHEECVGCEVPA